MKRHLLTAATLGVFGLLALAGDASACCHKRKACAAPCPAPAPCVVEVAPAPCPPVECAPRKKHCFSLKLFHHKNRCQPVCATPCPAPVPPPAPAPCPC